MTQKEIVIEKLNKDKEISRNWALQQRITRLAAIIKELEADHWVFNAHWKAGDYVYEIAESPIKKKVIRKPIIDRETRMFKGYEEIEVE